MSLFDSCKHPGCDVISSIQCTSQQESRDFCPKHAGKFFYQGGINATAENTNIPISAEECELINQVNTDALRDRIVADIQAARDLRINQLQQEIAQTAQDFLQKVHNAVEAIKIVQTELEALVLHKKAPLNKPGHFADVVAKLKLNNALGQHSLEDAIQVWAQTCDLQGDQVGTNLTQTSPHRQIMQLANPTVDRLPIQVSTRDPSRYKEHRVIELAREHGCDPQSEKEAVEYLCRRNYVFDSTKDPILSLDFLDLSGADLSGGVFIGISFEGSNLKRAELKNAILWNTNLKKCRLRRITVAHPTSQYEGGCYANIQHSLCGKIVLMEEYRKVFVLEEGTHPAIIDAFDKTCWKVKVACLQTGIYLIELHLNCVKISTLDMPQSKTVFNISDPRTCALSPDNKYVAAANSTNLIVWDVMDCSNVRKMDINAISLIVYSQCSKYLAVVEYSNRIVVCDAKSLVILKFFVISTSDVIRDAGLKFIPNANLLVSGNSKGRIEIWNFDTGDRQAMFTGYNEDVCSVDVSPCGRYIIVGDQNTENLELYDMNGHICTYKRHIRPGNCAAFSPCGKFILSVGSDRRLIKWVNWKMLVDDGVLQEGGDWASKQYSGVTYDQASVDEATAIALRG